jgi:hypothetical protein
LALSAVSALSGGVTGPYSNRISSADVSQIKSAVSKVPDISHNLTKIEAIRADLVAIQTRTRTGVDEDTYYDFKAQKRSGVWKIDPNSVQVSIEQRDFRTNGPAIIR